MATATIARTSYRPVKRATFAASARIGRTGNARKSIKARCDYSKALVTLQGTQDAVAQMSSYSNHQGRASLRLAVWGAIVTPQTALVDSCTMLHALRAWAMGGLPEDGDDAVQAVYDAMTQALGFDNLCEMFAQRIVTADRQIATGKFDSLLDRPDDNRAAWLAWRKLATRLCGLGNKTASMVAMTLWPMASWLIPVDTHVCGRLGRDDAYGRLSSEVVYLEIETIVLREYADAHVYCSPVIWHWYKWSQRRQACGDELASVVPESHQLLSPYFW